MAPCFCGRAPRGFVFHRLDLPGNLRPPGVDACSLSCLEIIASLKGSPEMPNRHEERAVDVASERIGQYLENIGKSDLAAMTGEEWSGFLLYAFACTAEEVRNIVAEEVPF